MKLDGKAIAKAIMEKKKHFISSNEGKEVVDNEEKGEDVLKPVHGLIEAIHSKNPEAVHVNLSAVYEHLMSKKDKNKD